MADEATVGVATRPHPDEVVNGDSWAIHWNGDQCRISVIDGLGHGPAASEASRAARETLAKHPELEPIEAVAACHPVLSGTRGATMSVALIDPVARQVTYSGIGNVETRLWQGGQGRRLVNYRGIVGVRLSTFRSIAVDLKANWILVMHSDGVSARFEIPDVLKLAGWSPQSLAETILRMWGRETDDATVLVAAANCAFTDE